VIFLEPFFVIARDAYAGSARKNDEAGIEYIRPELL